MRDCRRKSATAAAGARMPRSATLSKATNTTEPDGNGVNPDQGLVTRLGEGERGPSLRGQRHRAVITFSYQCPLNITVGTLTQFASSRPFNATTGVDNNGDGANNDRPVIDGKVIGKSAFRSTPDFRRGTLPRESHQAVRTHHHPAQTPTRRGSYRCRCVHVLSRPGTVNREHPTAENRQLARPV